MMVVSTSFLYPALLLICVGGCCPSDYVCGRSGCTPSVGVSFTETCGLSHYLCPASLGYGCCKSGMGCGIGNCYSTEIVSLTMPETITTTSSGVVQTLTSTLTTAVTPQAPTGLPTTGQSGVIAKVTSSPETPIPKTKASNLANGGLSSAQLGGIIGGAVLILIAIIVAAFFIIKRLNNVKGIVESRRSSSGPRSRESKPAFTPDLDAMSVDPLMIASSDVSRSIRHGSHPSHPPSAIHSSHHEVEASSPPQFNSSWSPRSPPYNYNSGYTPVATSDSVSSAGHRNSSLESTPGMQPTPSGYFDFSPSHDLRDQNLRFGRTPGRRPSKHERQWSEASEQSDISLMSQTTSQMAELDANPSTFQRALQGFGLSRLLSRRKSSTPIIVSSRKTSEPVVLTGGPIGRVEWVMTPNGLGHIPEAGESRLNIQEVSPGLSNAEMRELTLTERE